MEDATLVGTWSDHTVSIPDGTTYVTGIEKTNPWWHVDGKWFGEGSDECVVGTAFSKKFGVSVGDTLNVHASDSTGWHTLKVVGLLSTGSSEENAVVAPIAIA